MIRRGINAYVAELPGFYVVNPTTNIAVSGWPTHEEAERDIVARDARYPDDAVKLTVVRLPSGCLSQETPPDGCAAEQQPERDVVCGVCGATVTPTREHPGGFRDIDGRWHDD
jgi:hypothetical protein